MSLVSSAGQTGFVPTMVKMYAGSLLPLWPVFTSLHEILELSDHNRI